MEGSSVNDGDFFNFVLSFRDGHCDFYLEFLGAPEFVTTQQISFDGFVGHKV
jgi:hypothetical protein